VPATVDGETQEGWEVTVREAFATAATSGIPADPPRANSRYRHPLAGLFPVLEFEPTPQGNRGTYEQIIDVGPTVNTVRLPARPIGPIQELAASRRST
jgi:hypothetical protein